MVKILSAFVEVQELQQPVVFIGGMSCVDSECQSQASVLVIGYVSFEPVPDLLAHSRYFRRRHFRLQDSQLQTRLRHLGIKLTPV